MKEITIQPDALARFRAAASEFAGTAKPRVSRLEGVRDEIAAMRAKGASFRTVSEMLSRCGIHASDTCVMRFCHRVLGEQPFHARNAAPRAASRRNSRTTPRTIAPAKGPAAPPAAPLITEEAKIALLDDLLSCQTSGTTKSSAQGGPRIAKIQFAKPDEQ
jgi:hypothetical protein